MPRRNSPLAAVILAASLVPAGLRAQPTKAPASAAPAASPPPAASAPSAAAIEEAQRRYNRALELFNEGSYDAALLEFRRAYELAPSWRILYNIGQVNVQLNDYARALEAFERYLSEGGAEVPAARLTEVKTQVERLKGRVATLEITSNVEGAEVTVDDLPVGKTPLSKPVVVNAGRRKVGITASGRLPQTRIVEAAGSDRVKVPFELVSPETAPTATVTATATAPTPTERPGPQRHVFWPGWVATGVLGAGAVVTGILSLGATSDYNSKLDEFGVSRGDLDDQRKKARTLSIVTDVLVGATLVTGGVSLYLSLRTTQPASGKRPGPSVGLRISPTAVGLGGTF